MAIKSDREYRMVSVEFRAKEEEEQKYIVEGYATTFNDPYVLYTYDGVDYKEEVDQRALDGADMDDVIFLYNHEGMVFARQSNGSLKLEVEEKGLRVWADLSLTEDSRRLYEAIKTGLVTQMSWAFTVEEDSYNEKEHLRKLLKIRKVYDVSAVSIPANPATDISARAYFDGVIEEQRRRDLEREKQKQRIRIKSMR